MTSQGALANKAGVKLETIIENILIDNYIIYANQVIFSGIYKIRNKMDFLININNKNYAIEVKNQNVSGSVDEKIPYCMLNGELIETDGFILILEGLHFEKKKGIKEWALNFANNSKKDMYVFNLAEFEEWLTNEQSRNNGT